MEGWEGMLDRMLEGLRSQRSVTQVTLFELDGFVLTSSNGEDTNPLSDEVRAWLDLIETAENSQLITLVHQHGYILLKRLVIGILLIRTTKDVNLGSLRLQIEKVADEGTTSTS